jgi:glycosyltransferase involved in cell wall biosynthesis
MIDLSVIICTRDPRADYLRRVLDALRNQSLPKSQWELLLIDNASTERLESTWDITWHPNARHVLKGDLGLAQAHQRGVREATADLLLIMQDDNILDPNYLSEAERISHEWPRLDLWGSGATSLVYEVEPPEHLKEFASILGFRNTEVT